MGFAGSPEVAGFAKPVPAPFEITGPTDFDAPAYALTAKHGFAPPPAGYVNRDAQALQFQDMAKDMLPSMAEQLSFDVRSAAPDPISLTGASAQYGGPPGQVADIGTALTDLHDPYAELMAETDRMIAAQKGDPYAAMDAKGLAPPATAPLELAGASIHGGGTPGGYAEIGLEKVAPLGLDGSAQFGGTPGGYAEIEKVRQADPRSGFINGGAGLGVGGGGGGPIGGPDIVSRGSGYRPDMGGAYSPPAPAGYQPGPSPGGMIDFKEPQIYSAPPAPPGFVAGMDGPEPIDYLGSPIASYGPADFAAPARPTPPAPTIAAPPQPPAPVLAAPVDPLQVNPATQAATGQPMPLGRRMPGPMEPIEKRFWDLAKKINPVAAKIAYDLRQAYRHRGYVEGFGPGGSILDPNSQIARASRGLDTSMSMGDRERALRESGGFSSSTGGMSGTGGIGSGSRGEQTAADKQQAERDRRNARR
jgi:hypothetical protein